MRPVLQKTAMIRFDGVNTPADGADNRGIPSTDLARQRVVASNQVPGPPLGSRTQPHIRRPTALIRPTKSAHMDSGTESNDSPALEKGDTPQGSMERGNTPSVSVEKKDTPEGSPVCKDTPECSPVVHLVKIEAQAGQSIQLRKESDELNDDVLEDGNSDDDKLSIYVPETNDADTKGLNRFLEADVEKNVRVGEAKKISGLDWSKYDPGQGESKNAPSGHGEPKTICGLDWSNEYVPGQGEFKNVLGGQDLINDSVGEEVPDSKPARLGVPDWAKEVPEVMSAKQEVATQKVKLQYSINV